MNYAINRDEIIKGVYGEAGQPAKNPIPPTMWSYNDNIKPYEYDVAKAKALLAEAGYSDGFKTEIWAMPVARPYNPDARKIAEIMQAQLAKINVEVEIISYEWGTYLDKTDTGEHQAAMLGWTGDNGDPDNFLFVLLSIPAAEVPAGKHRLLEERGVQRSHRRSQRDGRSENQDTALHGSPGDFSRRSSLGHHRPLRCHRSGQRSGERLCHLSHGVARI